MYLNTRNTVYEVEINGDGTLKICINGEPVKNAGRMIASMGGVDAVKARLETVKRERVKPAPIDRSAEISAARKTVKQSDAPALDLIEALKVIAKDSRDFGDADLNATLTGDNALTRALLAFGGAYSFSLYESGELVIKYDNGRRFTFNDRRSELRDTRPVKSIINEEE